MLTEEKIIRWLKNEDAWWLYPGEPDPKIPHAELSGGKCSNGFIDCMKILRYPNINEILAGELYLRLCEAGIIEVDWVVGSPYAAITFAYEIARKYRAIAAFCEKDLTDPRGKRMLWRRAQIPEETRVLQVEELITTSGTFREIRRAVTQGNGGPVSFIPEVGTFVHRPEKLPKIYGNRRVVAVLEKEIQIYEPENCPYCAVGSKRLRPKQNWGKLNRRK